jgi:hypothetical protein
MYDVNVCRMGSAVNTGLIARGVLAGAVGGLVAFIFVRICAEPIVGQPIKVEAARMQAAPGVHEHGAELFRLSTQATAGTALAIVSFGAAMGALLAVAFVITYRRIDSVRPGALTLLLAADAFATLSLVPSMKYRPPLGREAIISQRTGLYLLMVALSVALVIGAVTLGRGIAGRLGTGNATLISATLYVAGIAAAMWLLPPVDETQDGFSGYDHSAFMLHDLGTQLVLWATVAVVFARLASRMLDASDPSASSTPSHTASAETAPRRQSTPVVSGAAHQRQPVAPRLGKRVPPP